MFWELFVSSIIREIARSLNPRIKQKPESKYFYALDSHDSNVVRFTGILGLLSLIFLAAGYVNFLRLSMWATVLFVPLFVIVLLYYFIQYVLLIQYPGFNVYRHEQRVARYKQSALKDHY